AALAFRQQCLYFLPLPQGQGALRPICMSMPGGGCCQEAEKEAAFGGRRSNLLALEERLQAFDLERALGPTFELLGLRITQPGRNPARQLTEPPPQLTVEHAGFAFAYTFLTAFLTALLTALLQALAQPLFLPLLHPSLEQRAH